MKKRLVGSQYGLLVFSFIFLFYVIGSAQTATLNVISANGGYSETPGLSVSWSVGEISIGTQTNASAIMTQGFQQSFPLMALPIELLSFSGEVRLEGNELKWETGSEINNDFFTLWRSSNGYSYSEVAIIEGAGSSFTQQNYQYLDIDASTGLSYYQLEQTDHDGQTSLSQIISLRRFETNSYGNLNLHIFPNPTSDELTVSFNHTLKEDMQIQIHDLCGRLLQTRFISTGQQKINVNLVGLPEGIYFLSLQNLKNQRILSTNRIVKSSL